MKFASAFALVTLIGFFSSFTSQPTVIKADSVSDGPNKRSFASCSCTDVGDLTNRLKGVEAVLRELGTQTQGPAGRGTFDANTFDEGLGESITKTLATTGGISSMVIADIDRFSCEISTGANLGGVPGLPAGLGGSACLIESVTAQLEVRRQACLAAQTPSNQGNDYWEGQRMANVIRELSDAYTAEANFIKQQLGRLAPLCKGPGTAAKVPPPPKNVCTICIQYLMDGERTLPVVGRIRMFANDFIPFTVTPDNKVTGDASIHTELDMSGSPCKVSGYNGVADILVNGELLGGYLNVTVTPKGSSQRTSSNIKMTCPPKGRAQLFPVGQNYSISESLKLPNPGQKYTEKKIDLNTRTMGAMQGYIILRLFMSK